MSVWEAMMLESENLKTFESICVLPPTAKMPQTLEKTRLSSISRTYKEKAINLIGFSPEKLKTLGRDTQIECYSGVALC